MSTSAISVLLLPKTTSCTVHTSKRAQKQSSGRERGLGQGTDRGGRGQGRPASNRSQEAPARLRGAPSVATCLDDGAHSSASWESRSRLGHTRHSEDARQSSLSQTPERVVRHPFRRRSTAGRPLCLRCVCSAQSVTHTRGQATRVG